jgi:hypothetical protein
MARNRNAFTFVFTATLAAVFLIATGLIGYAPPAHLSLDVATWRRGVWTGGVILNQVALGSVLLVVAGLVALRLNRRLPSSRSRR